MGFATRGQRLGLGLFVGVVVVVAGVLIAVQMHADALGCGSIDPTDPANYSEVTILNDTPAGVIVGDCVGSYCPVDERPAHLSSGQRFSGHAACEVSGADMTSWQLRSNGGRILGYVAVDTPRKHDGLVFDVLHASRDRRTPTPSG
jgi:hypothetical protein